MFRQRLSATATMLGVVPDGDVGQQAFAVIRDAIRKEGMVALGKVVFTTRELIIALSRRSNSRTFCPNLL